MRQDVCNWTDAGGGGIAFFNPMVCDVPAKPRKPLLIRAVRSATRSDADVDAGARAGRLQQREIRRRECGDIEAQDAADYGRRTFRNAGAALPSTAVAPQHHADMANQAVTREQTCVAQSPCGKNASREQGATRKSRDSAQFAEVAATSSITRNGDGNRDARAILRPILRAMIHRPVGRQRHT
jgi:hypothetical protein